MKKVVRIILVLISVLAATYFGISSKYIDDFVSEIGDTVSAIVQQEETQADAESAEFIVGKVTRVSDGDTVILTDSKKNKTKVRLDGIDAPEIGQEYGDESKEFVEKLILNKNVKVKVIGVDKYKRTLGVIYLDNLNINEELLANGLAWQYHYNKNEKYTQLVKSAKSNGLNIWSDRKAMDPYEWRKKNK